MTNVISKQAFFDYDISFTKDLRKAYDAIKHEFQHTVEESAYIDWPEKFLYNEGWNIFGLRYQGQDFQDAHRLCPTLSALIYNHDTLISSAGFSILRPGTIIKPHVGYTEDVLRCHLGIEVPAGNCMLKVGDTSTKWQEGEVIIFDDTIEHEAWNKTNETRIVLLIDLFRKALLQYL